MKISARDENEIVWETNDIITHVPGDRGSISDIQYIDIDKLPKPEHQLHEEDVLKIIKELKTDSSSVRSVVVADDNGELKIVDGMHRIEAARRLGIKKVPTRFWTEEPGKFLARDLKNFRDALVGGQYSDKNELLHESERLLNEFKSDILSNKEYTDLASDILMRLPNFSMRLSWVREMDPNSEASKRLNKNIEEEY